MKAQEIGNSGASGARVTALVLAASRQGVRDSVAQLQDKSHKCLVEIDGVVMLERVIEALIKAGGIDRVYVSIESDDLLHQVPRVGAWMDQGRVRGLRNKATLADSVLAAAADIPDPYPLLITTGDNVLHTPELIRDFLDQCAGRDGDVAVAFTTADLVRRDYPEVKLAYHMLKDGGFSACNLYLLRRARALNAVRVFESGGQFGKRHFRILKSCGLMPFILYKLKWATLDGLMDRIARNLGVTTDTIMLPYSFGPIDVDNPQFFAIAEEALRRRRLSA